MYPKISDFYLRDRKIYLRDKNFFGLGTIFFGLGRSAQRRFRKFFGLQIIKDIKVFRAQKLDFNISGDCSGGLSMTSFFNTNLSNLSNIAERLPEGTIRFVLCTNLANDSNAMRTANLVSIRVIRGGKKLTHSIELDKFVRFVFKIILISRPPE